MQGVDGNELVSLRRYKQETEMELDELRLSKQEAEVELDHLRLGELEELRQYKLEAEAANTELKLELKQLRESATASQSKETPGSELQQELAALRLYKEETGAELARLRGFEQESQASLLESHARLEELGRLIVSPGFNLTLMAGIRKLQSLSWNS